MRSDDDDDDDDSEQNDDDDDLDDGLDYFDDHYGLYLVRLSKVGTH